MTKEPSESVNYQMDANQKVTKYVTAAGLKNLFDLKSNNDPGNLMIKMYEKYKDDDLNSKYPIGVNLEDKYGHKLGNSPVVRFGNHNQPIKGIRSDIVEMEYTLYINNAGANVTASVVAVDDALNNLKKKGFKISTNRDVMKALLPYIGRLEMENKALNESLQNLNNSVVIRKNIPYEVNPYGNVTIQDFGIDPKPQPKYVTDTNGYNYADYQKWLKEDPNNKPDVPKH